MNRIYNVLTILVLALTVAFIAWAGALAIDPTTRLNPFPPPRIAGDPASTGGSQPGPVLASPGPKALITSVGVIRLPTSTPVPPTATWTLPATDTRTPTATTVVSEAPPQIPPTLIPATTSPAGPTEVPPTSDQAGQPPAAAPGPTPRPLTSSGGFELGGQVAGFDFPDKMQYAGMVWVKRQLRWGPGADPGEAAGLIGDAHARGFKILLSVLGDPDSIRGGANESDYASYAGGVAALGADAIEVWNEMNIDREWPAGEISPAAYTELLRQAYTAIKSRNPGTLVVSGAPAPTGFFGGCSGGGCDDAPYVQGMVNAGALSYLDCLGIHYNEGVVSPAQTSGDPRGNPNHYTRYFKSMVDTYYNAAGGRKKLCFTELGYLSGDGFSPALADVAPGFAWAANTSVAEQAQWLAEAVSVAQAGPKVRLIIIFNVDLRGWGADPQGGYAIVRPDGGCPACESLRAVTGGR